MFNSNGRTILPLTYLKQAGGFHPPIQSVDGGCYDSLGRHLYFFGDGGGGGAAAAEEQRGGGGGVVAHYRSEQWKGPVVVDYRSVERGILRLVSHITNIIPRPF